MNTENNTPKRMDLTEGPIFRNLIRLSLPIIFGMLMFTLYLLIDLFFVGRLGPDAVAAVSISGNAFFVHLGLSYILGTGGMALIAQAFGRKDFDHASKVFKQSLVISIYVGILGSLIGFAIARPYIEFFGGTGQSLKWGVEYFQIFAVSLFFVLLLHVIGYCYRGMGDTKTPMYIILQSIILNIVLDPILIFGLLGFPRLGVRGAAIASLVSQLYALCIYVYLIFIRKHHLDIHGPWRLDLKIMKKSLAIGLPSGLTYFLLAFNMLITYRVIGAYGTQAVASLGIGFRILQSIYLPSVAVSSAMAAMIGQNFGANQHHRITKTLWAGWALCSGFMLSGTMLCQGMPSQLISIFTNDEGVIHYGIIYLTIFSLGTAVVGTIMAYAAAFQGLGKTYPTLIGAVIDNALFASLVFTLPGFFGWGIRAVWWIKLFTAAIEMVIIVVWLKKELQGVPASPSPQVSLAAVD